MPKVKEEQARHLWIVRFILSFEPLRWKDSRPNPYRFNRPENLIFEQNEIGRLNLLILARRAEAMYLLRRY
jgi:hypothetical protein